MRSGKPFEIQPVTRRMNINRLETDEANKSLLESQRQEIFSILAISPVGSYKSG